jgi:hypothetical protein
MDDLIVVWQFDCLQRSMADKNIRHMAYDECHWEFREPILLRVDVPLRLP